MREEGYKLLDERTASAPVIEEGQRAEQSHWLCGVVFKDEESPPVDSPFVAGLAEIPVTPVSEESKESRPKSTLVNGFGKSRITPLWKWKRVREDMKSASNEDLFTRIKGHTYLGGRS